MRRLRGSGGGAPSVSVFAKRHELAEENCIEKEPSQPSDAAVAGLAAAAVAAAATDASVAS